jgi:uncharacterized protein
MESPRLAKNISKTLIGREKETHLLQTILSSHEAEFLALYGRRRVGKTFLIREFFHHQDAIFFNATGAKDGRLQEQIQHFTEEIGHAFFSGITPNIKKTWDETFKLLTDVMTSSVPPKKKIILFFDELPWLTTRNSRLLQSLDYYWNRYWSMDNRIKLIICGSSASWMIQKIINNRGGLHNRITRKIHLQPFNLAETKLFLYQRGIKLNTQQILSIYMVTGGIPYYLMPIEKGLSSAQIIESLVFSRDSLLLTEFDNLFPSLFDHHETYISIIREIAKYRSGIGKRALLEKLDKSQLGGCGLDKLNQLEDAGFIMSFTPHFHKKRGIYYRIIDEYTLFYFHWIEPIKDALQARSLDEGNWQEIQNSPAWNTWLGYAFEAVCYKHISQIRKKLGISATAIANSWRFIPTARSKEIGAQIDLLFDRRDDTITLCEIKYSHQPFIIDKAYANNLLNKRNIFLKKTKTKKQIFLALITTFGLQENLYANDLISGVVTLDDLFL